MAVDPTAAKARAGVPARHSATALLWAWLESRTVQELPLRQHRRTGGRSMNAASVGPADGVRVSAGSDHRASGASNTPDAAYARSYSQRLLRIPLPLAEGDGELVIPSSTSEASFDQILSIIEAYKVALRDE